MGLLNFLKSTILSKVVMASTGVILVLFIIGHTVGNLQIYLGSETFNHYAHFLQGLGELLWIIRIVLFLSLVLHVITAIRLFALNSGAKPVKYKIKKYVRAKLTARTMIWTGLMIFAFLVYHLLHFTTGTIHPENYGHEEYYESNIEYYQAEAEGDIEFMDAKYKHVEDGKVLLERHNAYYMVIKGFQDPISSILYIIGVVLLGFHLSHAIQSCFQTLGIHGPKFTPWMIRLSNALSFIIVVLLISIPITILLGLVGGCL